MQDACQFGLRKEHDVIERRKKVKCTKALTDTIPYPFEKTKNFLDTCPRAGMVYHHETESGGQR
jgi:hypothetical protein